MTSAQTKKVETIRENLIEIQEKLQEQFDSKSEKWQESDAGEKASEEIEQLGDAIDALEF